MYNFKSTLVETHIDIVTADHLPKGHLVTETVGWLIRVHWHVQYISGVVGGEDAGNRTGQGAPTVCVCGGGGVCARCVCSMQ